MSVQAIGTNSIVFQTETGLSKVKTLKIKGDASKDDAPIEIKFNGQRYTKQTIKNADGKEQSIYVCIDEDMKEIKSDSKEYEKYTIQKTSDGKDDGKISWEERLLSAGKGIIKPFKEMFSSVKKAAITVGVAAAAIGACFIPGVGPFIAAGLLYGGLALGAGTAIVGGVQAAKAKTDAEARNGWENIGSGVFTAVTSAIGLKSFKAGLATKATALEKATHAKAGTINCLAKTNTKNIRVCGLKDRCGIPFKEGYNTFKTIYRSNKKMYAQNGEGVWDLPLTSIKNKIGGVDVGIAKKAKLTDINDKITELNNLYTNLLRKRKFAEAKTTSEKLHKLLAEISNKPRVNIKDLNRKISLTNSRDALLNQMTAGINGKKAMVLADANLLVNWGSETEMKKLEGAMTPCTFVD